MSNMDKKSTRIECIWRRYCIKIDDNGIINVESTSPRSEQEEISEIYSFFSNFQIISINQLSQYVQEGKIAPVPAQLVFSPCRRFNVLLKMKGEFTSKDYREYLLKEYNIKLSKYVASDDITLAVRSERVEMLGEKSGRFRLYRVIDSSSVNDALYSSMLNDNKIKVEAI